MTRPREAGYALVAAVASIAVFAAMATALIAATGSTIDDADADQAQLAASAAADAGLAIAIAGLAGDRPSDRWTIDGRVRAVGFGAATLRIRIEDERGKVPINRLDEGQATRLLEQSGMSGDPLLVARDSLLDWIDGDDDRRPFGAEASFYRGTGIAPANGFVGSVDDLGAVRGFTPALVAALRPIATSYAGLTTTFDPRFADPRAIAVMTGGIGDPVAAIAQARAAAGQRTAIDFTAEPIIGRPLTIIVDAAVAGGGHAARRLVMETTGDRRRPYIVRAYD